MRTLVLAFAAFAAVFAAASSAHAQASRRDREDPELVPECNGRMGACDDLRFTPDGKQLLAVGDDKVVRVWTFADGKLDPKSRALRWGVWHEQYGSIYALDISRDGKRVVIGGLAAAATGPDTVAVLDLASGRTLDSTYLELANGAAIWAAAFAPSGNAVAFGGGDGSIWLWDFHDKPRRLGQHHGDRDVDNVRLLRFTDDDHLLSLAEDGKLLEWQPNEKDAAPNVVLDVGGKGHIFRAEISPNGQLLAAAPQGPSVRIFDLQSRKAVTIDLKEGETARALAFDPKSNRLAVAVRSLVPPGRFLIDADDRLVFYDLDKPKPEAVAGPSHTYRADRLTFLPQGGFLAVAGGDNHEVTLWDLAQADKPVSVLRGTGSCLWDVALSEDGQAFGFRDQRDPTSDDPNARGRGPWRVFDLSRTDWMAPNDFKPVPRLASAGGWTVQPDAGDPYIWYAVHESGVRVALPLNRYQDGMPRCYTFLKALDGGPVRLAVGHYWGLSVFELRKGDARSAPEARRTRLCIGCQGEVTALAPSADQTWLMSCSNDMTLAAWNLAKEWPSQPILGASFQPTGKGLVVKSVDPGGPLWEAGLLVKDEVLRVGFAGKWLDDDPAVWTDRLARPVPGLEQAFEVRRGDQKVIVKSLLKQRPLWRFFPSGDREWVLWMWRNSFYDTSANGDYAIGWHVNAVEPKDSPTFYPAEQFREVFHKHGGIMRLLNTRDPGEALRSILGDNPKPLHFDGIEPPAVDLKLAATAAVAGKDVEATVSVYARGDNPDETPFVAELWINDYRLPLSQPYVEKWAKAEVQKFPKSPTRTLTLSIPYDKLRAGRNVVTFQTWNRLGVRSDTSAVLTCDRPAPVSPRVIGLAVGINDYTAANPGPGNRLDNLHAAVNDAQELAQAWAADKLFGARDIVLLTDKKATRQGILNALDDLAKRAKPDDQCIIFLSGHGDTPPKPPDLASGLQREFGAVSPHSSATVSSALPSGAAHFFVFCTPDYNPSKLDATGLSTEELADALAAIPCRKLVLLDACHSAAAANPVRGFAPGNQGPVILAACEGGELSWEDPNVHHGLFTKALLATLDDTDDYPDHNGKKLLYVDDLFRSTCRLMPGLLGGIGQKEIQHPVRFPRRGDNYPLASGD